MGAVGGSPVPESSPEKEAEEEKKQAKAAKKAAKKAARAAETKEAALTFRSRETPPTMPGLHKICPVTTYSAKLGQGYCS